MLVSLLAIPGPAQATWPGTNGQIFFVCRAAGVGFSGQDICSIKPDGSGLTNLTRTPAQSESEPDVSKDGTQVSFTRSSGGDTFVWVMKADGTAQQQVTDVPSTGTSWTPDGKIAFRGEVSDGVYEFRIAPAAGGPSTFLKAANPSDSPPRYTSDGAWLYGKFAPVSPGSGISTTQTFVVDGTTEKQVTASSPVLNSNVFPSWSPDGGTIFYNRLDAGDDDVYKVSRSGGAEVQVTNTPNPVDERWASLSPDGKKLIYQQEDTEHDFFHQRLFIANADGSAPVPIATPTLDLAQFPVWAPGPVSEPPPTPKAAFTATGPKASRATKPATVELRCTGDTRCAVTYGAKLTVPRKGKRARKFSIGPRKTTLGARTDKTVKLKVPAAANGLVKKALNAGKKLQLKVTVAASQPDGPAIRTVRLSIRLKK
ncbi:MAG: TolB family protein [Solirubrobacterales bacterium]